MNFGDEQLQVCLATTDKTPMLELRSLSLQQSWGPVPLLELDIYNGMDQRVSAGNRVSVLAEYALDGGCHLDLFHRPSQIALGLTLTVRRGRLCIRLPMSQWREDDSDVYRLYTAHVLPGLMQVGPSGSVLLPLGAGARFSPGGKPAVRDQFLMYGEQSRWELLPMLPVTAAGEGDWGVTALMTGCPEDASLAVWTDGAGRGGVDVGASLRQHWIDPVDRADRELVFEPVAADPDLLHATADVMHRHAAEDLGMARLEDRLATSPELRAFMEGPLVGMSLGVCNRGIGRGHPLDEDYGRFVVGSTCAEAVADLRRMKAAGIEQLYARIIGFLPNGHDGCYPSHVRFDPRLGGREGFVALVEAAKALGYTINVHDNYNEGYAISPDFDLRWCMQDIYGEPQKRGRWGGGQAYLQAMLQLPEGRVEEPMQEFKALGLNGVAYIDAVGNPLYRNYHPDHGGPRRHHALGIERVLSAARRIHGGVITECGFLYAVRHCDGVFMPGHHGRGRPLRPEWPLAALIDEAVPLYRLALSGRLIHFSAGKAERQQALKAIQFGMHLSFGASHRPNYKGVVWDDAKIARMKAICDLCLPWSQRLGPQRLVRWEQTSEWRERTVFEDGTEVETSLEAGRLWINRKAVALPEGLPLVAG